LDWYFILIMVVAVAIVLFVPTLIWMAVISGLYQVARDRLRRRAAATRKRTVTMAKEPVARRIP
jgi:hypothetical protein